MPDLTQLDSTTLRAKFGEPLNRETFRTPQGFELIVDYGPNGEACRLEMPGEPESGMRQSLDDLVPESMRGKELNRGFHCVGGMRIHHVFYEHVSVYETDIGGRARTLSAQFRMEGCQP